MARAEKLNRTTDDRLEKPVYYRDFDISFQLNPITGSLIKLVNEQAVMRAMKNIAMTMITERPHSTLGSKVRASLFEPINPMTANEIQGSLLDAYKAHEPRAIIDRIDVNINADADGYDVNVWFEMVNNRGTTHNLSFLIERIR